MVLGIYVSGHPLEEDEAMWKKNVTNTTVDFAYDEEARTAKVSDNAKVTVGGIIESKTVKYTKSGKTMAFLSLEDLVGTVEVIVWPNDYEKNARYLNEESKVFIQGRVSAEEDKDAKVICEKIIPFEDMPKKLWIKLKTMDDFVNNEGVINEILNDSDGKDLVVIYIEATRQMKQLSRAKSVNANKQLVDKLTELFGEGNVKVV